MSVRSIFIVLYFSVLAKHGYAAGDFFNCDVIPGNRVSDPSKATKMPAETPDSTTTPVRPTPFGPTTTQNGCIVEESGNVLVEGETYVPPDCTRKDTCLNNEIISDSGYLCSPNAVCEVREGVRGCFCKADYEGDGLSCTYIYWTDCQDVGSDISGVYAIKPHGWTGEPFDVYCNMSNGGGWTVFQRRVDGTTDFFRNWAEYKAGFGNISYEFWLGNDKLYYLTNQRDYEVRVDMTDRLGNRYFATYTLFRIKDEHEKYLLSELGTYSGTAGDSLHANLHYKFSTRDSDNDGADINCGDEWQGGWWYKWCGKSNLNGNYALESALPSVWWAGLPGDIYQSERLKHTEIKVRPTY